MPRVGLSREVVIDAALALADEHGLASLTMRRLAAELDVEAMSLYNHVANKQEIHAGIVDCVWGEVDLARDEQDWRAALERMAVSAHRALVAHPWFFELPAMLGGVPRLEVIDAQVGHMRRAGIGPDVAFHAQHVIDGHVFGFSWQVIEFQNAAALEERAAEMLGRIDPEALPHLIEHARQHMEGSPEGDGFLLGLRFILDGLEVLREPPGASD